jgi:hypothetical protein
MRSDLEIDYHAQREGWFSTVREGNPIIIKLEPFDLDACVAGGVVTSKRRSRKCCSFNTTPYVAEISPTLFGLPYIHLLHSFHDRVLDIRRLVRLNLLLALGLCLLSKT